jgi:hypothetical protein
MPTARRTSNLFRRGPNVWLSRPRAGQTRPGRGDKVRDGWLDTGDLGCVDADREARLAGPAKDRGIRLAESGGSGASRGAQVDEPAGVSRRRTRPGLQQRGVRAWMFMTRTMDPRRLELAGRRTSPGSSPAATRRNHAGVRQI